MALAEVVANNTINVAIGYNPFYLNSSKHPPIPSASMHSKGVSSQIEVGQTMVDWMKTALEEAQANLTIAQSHTKSQVDCSRRDEAFEVSDEVVLSTHNITVDQHLPSKLSLDWTLSSHHVRLGVVCTIDLCCISERRRFAFRLLYAHGYTPGLGRRQERNEWFTSHNIRKRTTTLYHPLIHVQ